MNKIKYLCIVAQILVTIASLEQFLISGDFSQLVISIIVGCGWILPFVFYKYLISIDTGRKYKIMFIFSIIHVIFMTGFSVNFLPEVENLLFYSNVLQVSELSRNMDDKQKAELCDDILFKLESGCRITIEELYELRLDHRQAKEQD